MASEDVIELGSSDEDTAEPAAKKRKPPMVHIPDNVTLGSEMTIQHKRKVKPVINPASIMKGSSVTITKVSNNGLLKANPVGSITKVNGNASKGQASPRPAMKRNLHIPIITRKSPVMPTAINRVPAHIKINPAAVKKITKIDPKLVQHRVEMSKPQIVVRKSVSRPTTVGNVQICTIKKKPELNKLPPDLIITPTSSSAKKGNINDAKKPQIKPNVYKNPNRPMKVVTMSKFGLLQVKSSNSNLQNAGLSQASEVPTFDLDDDEPPAPPVGPQWYLRPEEQDRDPLGEDTNTETEPSNLETEETIEQSEQNSTKDSRTMPESSTLEKQNNKEPDKSTYIEITIEDSPIKPVPNKKGFQVGAELPIIIDDSPVRRKKKRTQNRNSDEEEESAKDSSSKKKLDYPTTGVQEVEIEFEPIDNTESTNKVKDDVNSQEVAEKNVKKSSPNKNSDNGDKNDSNSIKSDKSSTPDKSLKAKDNEKSKTDIDKVKTPKKVSQSREEKYITTEKATVSTADKIKDRKKSVVECIDIVEIEESPIKPDEEVAKTTPKKNNMSKPTQKISKPVEIIELDDNELSEFNSVYQSFLKLCLQLENSDDMRKIVEKKLKRYYREVPKDYTESDVFMDMVASKITTMKAIPGKMYSYIKDIVDELNVQRKMAKQQPVKKNEEQEKFLYGEESEFDPKRQRQIRKLEKTLKKLHRAILKLDEQEVDFEDEDDSVYLLTERYKERAVRVHAKLCQLTNTKMPSEARLIIDARPGQHKGPAKRLEKWINRKVPVGTPLPFPDFHDVLRCVREANKEDDIGWNEADVMEEARDLFVRCGKKLQRRRQENEWRLAASRVPPDSTDPVEEDCELKRKLEENRRLASTKETEVFNKYADRQKQLKLEAEEIGDKEAEESPLESDDEVEEVIEEPDTETDKQKRKDRIKKLLQNPKTSEDKAADEKKRKTKSPEGDKVEEDSTKAKRSGDEDKSDDKNEGESSKSKSKSDETDDEEDDAKSDRENNLLERRYSVSNNSSSDSESPVAIDTSSSDEMESKKPASDVISIENSSLSESEGKKDEGDDDKDDEMNSGLEQINEEEDTSKNADEVIDNTNNASETPMDTTMEIDSVDKEEQEKTNNKVSEDCNGLSEEVLLASTDDEKEEEEETDKTNLEPDTYINLRDDNISIGETMIIENIEIDGSDDSKEGKSDKNTDSSSVEGMEIRASETVSKECGLETVTEEAESLDTETQDILENTQTDKDQISKETANIESGECVKNVTNDADNTDDRTKDMENVDETICLSSVESVNSGNMNEINDIHELMDDSQGKDDKTPEKSSGDNVNDEVKNLDDRNNCIQTEKDLKDTNDADKENPKNSKLDKEDINEVLAEKEDATDTENLKENITDDLVAEAKENNNSVLSEAMEVDSQESL